MFSRFCRFEAELILMNQTEKKIILTGFMGVGKSSVARHLAYLLDCEKIDLDTFIEKNEGRVIADIINADGEAFYRQIETKNLKTILEVKNPPILALGGGAWTIEENRQLIKKHNFTSVWLETNFDHCWFNIKLSKRERPLAKNKRQTKKLFEDRQKFYCLADWHFIVKPEFTSYEVAKQIAEEVFSFHPD